MLNTLHVLRILAFDEGLYIRLKAALILPMLAHYPYCRHHETVNARDTLRAVPTEAEPVRHQLRTPMDVQGPAAAPAQPWLPPAPAGFSFPPQMVEVGGSGSSSQGAVAGAAGAVGAADPVGVAGSGTTAGGAAPRVRNPQVCRTCGHKMRVGPFKRYHTQFLASAAGSSCTVPQNLRRPEVNPTAQRAVRVFGGLCACLGDHAHPGGCSSA